jgi:hypothetical protein
VRHSENLVNQGMQADDALLDGADNNSPLPFLKLPYFAPLISNQRNEHFKHSRGLPSTGVGLLPSRLCDLNTVLLSRCGGGAEV